MSAYRLYVASDRTDHRVKGRSPAKALRELVEAAGLELASQDGRYGRLVDGRAVAAMTEDWGRVDGPDARTTRLLHGREVR
jgi:hypothetical protein